MNSTVREAIACYRALSHNDKKQILQAVFSGRNIVCHDDADDAHAIQLSMRKFDDLSDADLKEAIQQSFKNKKT